MTDPAFIHQAIISADAPPRSACNGSGRSVASADEVTCPACLRLAAERMARFIEPVVHDGHAIPAGDEPTYPAPGSAIPGMPGYVVAECGHRVAGSEWRVGCRTCERCPVKVLKFAIETDGRDRDATEFRPLPSDWWQMTPRERGDYLTRMERHLSTKGKEWARFGGIVEAPAEELTPAEVADLLGVTASTIRRWAATGRLTAKDGTPLTFRRDDLFPHLATEIPGTGA